MIDRPVRYGLGHSPHDEDDGVSPELYDPLGFWQDLEETVGQWQQGAGTDLTPHD